MSNSPESAGAGNDPDPALLAAELVYLHALPGGEICEPVPMFVAAEVAS